MGPHRGGSPAAVHHDRLGVGEAPGPRHRQLGEGRRRGAGRTPPSRPRCPPTSSTSSTPTSTCRSSSPRSSPTDLSGLAGPLSAALREPATVAVEKLIATPRFQKLWSNANRVAHEKLVAILEDKANYVSTTGGTVTLELGKLVTALGEDLGLPSALLDKIPVRRRQHRAGQVRPAEGRPDRGQGAQVDEPPALRPRGRPVCPRRLPGQGCPAPHVPQRGLDGRGGRPVHRRHPADHRQLRAVDAERPLAEAGGEGRLHHRQCAAREPGVDDLRMGPVHRARLHPRRPHPGGRVGRAAPSPRCSTSGGRRSPLVVGGIYILLLLWAPIPALQTWPARSLCLAVGAGPRHLGCCAGARSSSSPTPSSAGPSAAPATSCRRPGAR